MLWKDISFRFNQLRRAFGFRNITQLLPHIKTCSQNNFSISTNDEEPFIDIGQIATIDKSRRNTTPLPLPQHFGDTIHVDILFGAGTAHGGAKYALFLVDRATRYKSIYPLHNLTTDILKQFQQYSKDLGFTPKRFISDCDKKLFSSEVKDWLESNNSRIDAAPEGKQRQNGLAERSWRTILRMARDWIATSMLPPPYWWFAFQRATQVSNYIPFKINNQITTPHELVFKEKPNMRNLLLIFSVAYIRRKKNFDNEKIPNSQPHILAAILVGHSNVSNSPIFYHPHSQKMIRSDDFYLNESLPAGPTFDIAYNNGIHFNSYAELNAYLKPPTYKPNQTVFINIKDIYTEASIIALPTRENNVYTVKIQHDGSIHQFAEKYIHAINPYILPTNDPSKNKFFPSWLKHDSNITTRLDSFENYQHGKLLKQGTQYFFKPGRSDKNQAVLLQDFETQAIYLIRDLLLFQGNKSFKKIKELLKSRYIGKIIANHVSAKGLTSTDVPNLIQHKLLCNGDKKIWDDAYYEEFYGLKGLPAWVTITEAEYQRIKHKTGRALPTVAVSTLKHDENGNPKRAKYRIVVLGNLDPHLWNKSDTYAPIMSLIELRLFVSLAIHFKQILKSGDLKQAFCQATLPDDEKYVLKPPHGCPVSKPGTYWLLKRSLYGSKRSAKHWFDKTTSI